MRSYKTSWFRLSRKSPESYWRIKLITNREPFSWRKASEKHFAKLKSCRFIHIVSTKIKSSQSTIKLLYLTVAVPDPKILVAGGMPQDDKLKTLLWLSGLQLTIDDFNTIPNEFIISIIVCLHLVNSKAMKLAEAECVIQTVVDVHRNKVALTQYPNVINERAFRLSFLYSKLFFTLTSCINAVGLKIFQVDKLLKLLCFPTICFSTELLEFRRRSFPIALHREMHFRPFYASRFEGDLEQTALYNNETKQCLHLAIWGFGRWRGIDGAESRPRRASQAMSCENWEVLRRVELSRLLEGSRDCFEDREVVLKLP